MANIINIETSSSFCSVAWSKDGMVEYEINSEDSQNHAEVLAPFIEKCLNEMKRKEEKPDAIAISMGPGSYTGLRIGLSLAKGLAYSLDIPLIGISTLEILAVKAMFMNEIWEGDEIIIPMIDARRMEVFAAAFDFRLKKLMEEKPVILDEDSFAFLADKRKLIFIGDGAEKYIPIYKGHNAVWKNGIKPKASDMMALSEKYFREKKFEDIAYCVPNYTKEYQTTVPKKVIN